MKILNQIILLFLTVLILSSLSLAQTEPLDTIDYRVRAVSGDPLYFPEVGLGTFTYQKEIYCDRCVLVIGGMRIPGKIEGSPWSPICKGEIYLANGAVVVVESAAGGTLTAFDRRSGKMLVKFSAWRSIINRDASQEELNRYLQQCVEFQTLPSWY